MCFFFLLFFLLFFVFFFFYNETRLMGIHLNQFERPKSNSYVLGHNLPKKNKKIHTELGLLFKHMAASFFLILCLHTGVVSTYEDFLIYDGKHLNFVHQSLNQSFRQNGICKQ